ncbi:MAG: hypothetical protein KAG34_09650 [Cocleimonas sp.]|nr:hypothetical protein [Cocleimonas sp.]
MDTEGFDSLIESICAAGCIEVNQTISLLEKGKSSSELQKLNDPERQLVLKELKSIMDVYGGEVCSL